MTATPIQVKKIDSVIAVVRAELVRAMSKHGAMRSAHEAYGVLIEEVDEFFDEVKADNRERQRKELVQVAAVAARGLIDVY
jgi:NTP pyrophosphatase (non-canonical NTP hydrolase)